MRTEKDINEQQTVSRRQTLTRNLDSDIEHISQDTTLKPKPQTGSEELGEAE